MSTFDLSIVHWRKSSRSSAQGGDCIEVASLSTVPWRASSHSSEQGGQCIQIADLSGAEWRKSTHSAQGGDECVEVAGLVPVVAVRDSKDPDGPKLLLSPSAWRDLVARARA
ncbi:DUF397 domain-containing protein [Actinomadura oligospora]|uniref:DUF397 domain-containing protein n=1 Tax=Actinomadura oligospora TaxID=111804 RepID=UPI000479819A|nr:DUF397 domain-containing protein [Actinomadura oligospora]